MNWADRQYLDTAKLILNFGEEREDRTGTGTISLFAPPPMRFELTKGFPLLTTKKLPFRIIVEELLWFLRGSSNLKDLLDKNVNIWNKDAYRWYKQKGGKKNYEEFLNLARKEGFELGPIYPVQWRSWESSSNSIDQIKAIINSIKNNPTSRRHIVSAWNVGKLEDMSLPPCHVMFQAYVHNDGGLSLQMYQRSGDFFLGVPFNIASYSLLTHMIAQVTGLYAKEFIHVLGDAHIYKNHIKQIQEQMKREPKELPQLKLNPDIKDIDEFTVDDIQLDGYKPHPVIKGEISVGE